jgi:hypothetical protein
VAVAGLGVDLLPGPASADPAPKATRTPAGKGEALPAVTGGKEGKSAKKLATSREVEDKLALPLDVQFQDIPLRDALDFVQEATGVNLVVDKQGLAQNEVSLDVPINLRLKRVSARTALRLVLQEVNLRFFVEDGVLVVTSGTGQAMLVRRVYPVADLVGPAPKADNLIQVVTTTVEPGSWALQGGPGTIAYFAERQCLVVSQSASVQDQVRLLLEELRAVHKDGRGK